LPVHVPSALRDHPWGRAFFVTVHTSLAIQFISGPIIAAAEWDEASGNATWRAWFTAKMCAVTVFSFLVSTLLGRAPCLAVFRRHGVAVAAVSLLLVAFIFFAGVVLSHIDVEAS
jgi:hypothetical protein